MNSDQIRGELQRILGNKTAMVVPADGFEKIENGQTIVVNTAPAGTEGQHWLAFYRNPNDGALEMMDSYGQSLKSYPLVKKTLVNNSSNGEKIKYITGRLQSDNSDSCGVFALLYSVLRSKQFISGLQEFIELFDENDLELNDCIALYYLVEIFNSDNRNFKNVLSSRKCL
jgi:hypothetical protein